MYSHPDAVTAQERIYRAGVTPGRLHARCALCTVGIFFCAGGIGAAVLWLFLGR